MYSLPTRRLQGALPLFFVTPSTSTTIDVYGRFTCYALSLNHKSRVYHVASEYSLLDSCDFRPPSLLLALSGGRQSRDALCGPAVRECTVKVSVCPLPTLRGDGLPSAIYPPSPLVPPTCVDDHSQKPLGKKCAVIIGARRETRGAAWSGLGNISIVCRKLAQHPHRRLCLLVRCSLVATCLFSVSDLGIRTGEAVLYRCSFDMLPGIS